MRDVVAMVLAGGRVEELSVLTMWRPKAAVPFGGQYRIIDFALSSLMHSDIEQIGVLSMYQPSSLIEHIGVGEPWDLMGRGRGVRILPPFAREAESRWYRGTADAVYQNLHYVRKRAPRDVLIVSGDHIYAVDFRPVIEHHRDTDADLTMVVKQIPAGPGGDRFGYAEVDRNDRIIGYQEKPARPRSDLVSLTMYLFKTEVLAERLEENQRTGEQLHIYSEVLPAMIGRDRIQAHRYEGYWSYARSLDAYHQASMDLLDADAPIDLGRWGVRSRPSWKGLGDQPPVRILPSATCRDSVVAPGAVIAGSVERCVIGPGVHVGAGARVTASVVMDGTEIGASARVDRCVLDKLVRVGAGAEIGTGETEAPNRDFPASLSSGVSAAGKKALIPPGARVGRNCLVHPDVKAEDWPQPLLDHGGSLQPGVAP